MCLAIARTVILERRPVPMVARAMDVLVTSYSHSIKTGSYLKGIKYENTSPSTVPHDSIPGSAADVTASRVGVLGKSVTDESAAGAGSEHINRSSTLFASDPEENVSSEPPKTNTSDIQSVDGKPDAEKLLGFETSITEIQSSPLQQHFLGPANVSEQQEAQLSSPAISPDEMYSFVFSPVEEEMVGDPSYLVSIIVEFIRRYAVF